MNSIPFPLGNGSARCDPQDGALTHLEHPAHPGMNFLLGESEQAWHNRPFAWGKGFLVAGRESGQWDHPVSLNSSPSGLEIRYRPLPDVDLSLTRRFGPLCVETHTLINHRSIPLVVTSWGISTPFRDVYLHAQDCLHGACHAHLWTGGSYAYAWAFPMRGIGPGLGLALQAGALWSYSIQTRNTFTSSNVRGHIFLHVTDAARAPHSFGGQPEITIPPGAAYRLSWTLGWYPDFPTFESHTLTPPFQLPHLAAPVGQSLSIRSSSFENWTVESVDELQIQRPTADRIEISATTPGIKHLDLRRGDFHSRVAVLFHRSLREIVERRIAYILRHHQALDRAPDRQGAFLPVDTRTGLRIQGGNWNDWSDARERMAMPILLQYAVHAGWLDPATAQPALEAFDRFARAHLVDESGAVFEDSFHRSPHRLYNFPWLSRFFWNQFRLWKKPDDLRLCVKIVDRYYELGGQKFLAFWGEWIGELIDTLIQAGWSQEADRIQHLLADHAAYFLGLGENLPKHEVNYEQTVVAPLVLLLEEVRRRRPAAVPAEALAERMRWLLAFGGEQPHVRLRHIAIRHWDGFWFGAYRQWGDIMPHYWTVQTAAALLAWPRDVPFPLDASERQFRAEAILAANRAHFHDSGTATCAFVFPSCVDGNPAHHEDPVANDQDWALIYELHLRERG